jgi:predicted transposase YbfD/YdcC
MLALEGRIVIIDAMGTHTPIARQIVERSGYDVLALKNNQERLSAEASEQGRCHGAQRTLVAQRVGRLAAG